MGRWALVEPVDPVGYCPDCGFDSTRVHSRPVSRVADVPLGGRLEVRVRKRRLWCDNDLVRPGHVHPDHRPAAGCAPGSPPGSRRGSSTPSGLPRPCSVSAVGAEAGRVLAHGDAPGGRDGHRRARPRPRWRCAASGSMSTGSAASGSSNCADGPTVKIDPWSIVFTDLDTGCRARRRRRPARHRGPLVATGHAPRLWRARVADRGDRHERGVPGRDPRRPAQRPRSPPTTGMWPPAPTTWSPRCAGADPGTSCHRRGRVVDPAWKYRALLTCGQEHLSVAQRARLDQILAADPELAVVWAVKEIVVQLLATTTDSDFDTQWAHLETAVLATDLPEPAALFRTLKAWQAEIRVFCLTRVTSARDRGGEPEREEHQARRPRVRQPPQLPGPCPPRRDRQERGCEQPDHGQSRRATNRRLAVPRHADEVTKNVAATCRYSGISRTAFYRWQHRCKDEGLDGRKDRLACHTRARKPDRLPSSQRHSRQALGQPSTMSPITGSTSMPSEVR